VIVPPDDRSGGRGAIIRPLDDEELGQRVTEISTGESSTSSRSTGLTDQHLELYETLVCRFRLRAELPA
jgi:hypothetical protein